MNNPEQAETHEVICSKLFGSEHDEHFVDNSKHSLQELEQLLHLYQEDNVRSANVPLGQPVTS